MIAHLRHALSYAIHSRAIPAGLSLMLLVSAVMIMQQAKHNAPMPASRPAVLSSEDLCLSSSSSATLDCHGHLEPSAE